MRWPDSSSRSSSTAPVPSPGESPTTRAGKGEHPALRPVPVHPGRTIRSEDSLSIEIRPQPLPGPSLVRDYLAGKGEARRFYPGDPFSLDAYRVKLAEVSERFGAAERERAARALHPTSERARDRLERFVREGGAVVTTGQQTGLFTGPLFTVYKALTVARLAEALEERLGVIVLPVFWAASEDHDWAEVNHAFLLSDDDQVRRVEVEDGDPRPLPMTDRTLGRGIEGTLEEVGQLLAGQGFAPEVLRLLRGAYVPGRTFAGAFSEVLGQLLAPFDFLLTDAADPAVKAGSAGMLERALVDSARLAALLQERQARLLEAGYHAQVALMEGATLVFHHDAEGRERIDRHPEGFVLHDSRRRVDPDRLLAELRASPGRFSPNVLLRPVVESTVFPTLAYVGGPGELSYFAQLDVLFPEFGILPPAAYPRFSGVLVDRPIRHLLDRLGVTASDLSRPLHELESAVARSAMPPSVREGLADLRAAVVDGYRRLIEDAAAIDDSLVGALGSLRNESLAHLQEGERRIVQGLKRRERTTLAQLERLRSHLAPGGQPQERVLNVVPFLARYGPHLLREIAAAVTPAFGAAGDPETPAVSEASGA